MSRAKVDLMLDGRGLGKVHVNGVDFSRAVRGATVVANAGDGVRVMLEFAAPDVEALCAEAEIEVVSAELKSRPDGLRGRLGNALIFSLIALAVFLGGWIGLSFGAVG